MASQKSCCNVDVSGEDDVQICVKKCTLKTAEGEFECECICRCKKAKNSKCENCVCDCKCTPETAQKIETSEGVKYRCECTCSC